MLQQSSVRRDESGRKGFKIWVVEIILLFYLLLSFSNVVEGSKVVHVPGTNSSATDNGNKTVVDNGSISGYGSGASTCAPTTVKAPPPPPPTTVGAPPAPPAQTPAPPPPPSSTMAPLPPPPPQTGGGSSGTGVIGDEVPKNVSMVQFHDQFQLCASFLQNLFGDDQSQKGLPLINIVPTSLQVSLSVEISAQMKAITLSICEMEIVGIVGVLKELIKQWGTPNYQCPCVNTIDDLYARFEAAAPNLYKLFAILNTKFWPAWAKFIASLKGSGGGGSSCVADTTLSFQQRWNQTWSYTTQNYWSLQVHSRQDLADACGSISPTIHDLLQLTVIQAYFGLNGTISNNGGGQQCSGANEEYSSTGQWCCANLKTCDEPNKPCTMMCMQNGGACVCQQGFIRQSANGPCIPESQCSTSSGSTPPPSNNSTQCGQNEVPDKCGNSCEPSCDKPNPICPMFCKLNGGGCHCASGYIRQGSGGPSMPCIPKDQCSSSPPAGSTPPPSKQCSGANEEYSSTGQWCCANLKTCDQPNKPCTMMCMQNGGACVCQQGYIRQSANGPCVPESQCSSSLGSTPPPSSSPQQCTGANEQWVSGCSTACEAQCGNPHPFCPMIKCPTSGPTGHCACASGYIRQYGGGPCIPPSQCPSAASTPPPSGSGSSQQCGQNEMFDQCANGCEPSCDNPNQMCTMICKVGGGCKCASGYIRQGSGGPFMPCIPKDQCSSSPPGGSTPPPSKQCSGANEEYSSTGQWCCANLKTCDEPNKSCTLMCTMNGGACVCQQGFIRQSANGPCVPESQCSSSTGGGSTPPPSSSHQCSGAHEHWVNGCEFDCEPLCGTPHPPCPQTFVACKTDGSTGHCECDSGYIRQSSGGPCVPPSQCPSSSGGTTPPPSSSGNGNGQCPQQKCPGENEVWKECATSFCQESCANQGKPVNCPKIGMPCQKGMGACVCESGYLRDGTSAGKCVPTSSCPPSASGSGATTCAPPSGSG